MFHRAIRGAEDNDAERVLLSCMRSQLPERSRVARAWIECAPRWRARLGSACHRVQGLRRTLPLRGRAQGACSSVSSDVRRQRRSGRLTVLGATATVRHGRLHSVLRALMLRLAARLLTMRRVRFGEHRSLFGPPAAGELAARKPRASRSGSAVRDCPTASLGGDGDLGTADRAFRSGAEPPDRGGIEIRRAIGLFPARCA